MEVSLSPTVVLVSRAVCNNRKYSGFNSFITSGASGMV